MIWSTRFLFCSALVLTQNTRADRPFTEAQLDSKTANMEVFRACSAITSRSRNNSGIVFVFVLHVAKDFKRYFDYLWNFSQTHIYLAKPQFPLKHNDRVILISWERDPTHITREMNAYWDFYNPCGLRNCESEDLNLARLQLEKRVLIQIRELGSYLPPFLFGPEKIRSKMSKLIAMKFYYHFYRGTIIILRPEDQLSLHSSSIIKRSNRVVGQSVVHLMVAKLQMKELETIFDHVDYASNWTETLKLSFSSINFLEGDENDVIQLTGCVHGDNIFVYAYSFLPARLAVPLHWETRLVSNLPKYMALEIPITLVSLVVLPMILSMRRYRSLVFRPTIWESSYHLLSGVCHNSLINPSYQGTLMLLISGLISLLIQFPVNFLKREATAYVHEQRIQPSTCTVERCEFVGYREPWFFQEAPEQEFNIIRLGKEKSSVTESNLNKGCHPTSLATSNMLNWTELAFLAQYLTVCNDPELLKMRLSFLSRELVFEFIEGSHASQPVCSRATTHSGHVLHDRHVQTARQILEHDFLKYFHVKAALYPYDFSEERFWLWENFKRKNWGSATPIKRELKRAIVALKKGYLLHRMFDEEDNQRAIQFGDIESVFVVFFGITLTTALGLVLSNACISMGKYQRKSGERLFSGFFDVLGKLRRTQRRARSDKRRFQNSRNRKEKTEVKRRKLETYEIVG